MQVIRRAKNCSRNRAGEHGHGDTVKIGVFLELRQKRIAIGEREQDQIGPRSALEIGWLAAKKLEGLRGIPDDADAVSRLPMLQSLAGEARVGSAVFNKQHFDCATRRSHREPARSSTAVANSKAACYVITGLKEP